MTAHPVPAQRDLGLRHYTGLFEVPEPCQGSLSPDDTADALMVTAVGLIAGLVADAFIHAASAFSNGKILEGTWHVAIGLVLAASTFARHFTHFGLRPKITYSLFQFFWDAGLIMAGAVVVGLIDGRSFLSQAFWLATAAIGFFLLVRNIHITVRAGYARRVGTLLLWAGTGFCAWIAFHLPTSELVRNWFPKLAAFGALFQVIVETLNKRRGN